MLFNSFIFIFLFLPVTAMCYFLLNKKKLLAAGKAWLVFASLVFYAFWDIRYLPLLLVSIVVNFTVGQALAKRSLGSKLRRSLLWSGVLFNLALLMYFKYLNFFIENINHVTGLGISAFDVILPLGISFFTFTQITYIVDCYRGEVREYSFMNYLLFVTFFPHLIAGPIIHHREMMPQFDSLRNKALNWGNISKGAFLFSLGMFKKVMIADNLSSVIAGGFDQQVVLPLIEAWIASLAYTMQLYFDFSGYTDMALGISVMLNIRLPENFNSPYKAQDIQEFWRRWHITFSRFLREYIYIPLGGSRVKEAIVLRNVLITFLVCGVWHGAGWTFIAWGLLNGAAILIHRTWQRVNINIQPIIAWFITIHFINVCWVFFRAKTMYDAARVLKGMAGLNGINLPQAWENVFSSMEGQGIRFVDQWGIAHLDERRMTILAIGMLLAFLSSNSGELAKQFKFNFRTACFSAVIFALAVLSLDMPSEFIYFNF